MIYLVMFSMSFILLLMAKSNSIRYNFVRNILTFIALALPVMMAALRAETVGTDMKVYVIPFYEKAVTSNTFNELYGIFNYQLLSDPGYFMLTWLCSRISDDFHVGLFFYELIVIVFTYKALKRYNGVNGIKISIPLAMLWFYMMFFNQSLNIVRQMIAVSIIFFATSYLFNKNYKLYIVWSIIAILMHSSAIISLAIGVMYIFLSSDKIMTDKQSLNKAVIFVICLYIIIIFADNGIRYLVDHRILRANYLNYLSGGDYQTTRVAVSTLIAPLMYFFFAIIHYDKLKRRDENSLFLLMCVLMNFMASFGSGISTYLSRFSFYFIPFVMLTLLKEVESFKGKYKLQWKLFFTCLICFVWIFEILIRNYGETIPYLL